MYVSLNLDIFGVQVSLFKYRLREIDASINYYMEIQRGLEYRMKMFFDDSLTQQSSIIVEKLSVLYEKKAGIQRYIKQCESDELQEDGLFYLT